MSYRENKGKRSKVTINQKREWIKKLTVVILMIIFVFLKIESSEYRSVIYDTNGYSDEHLMLEYSDLDNHFNSKNENYQTLAKTLSFSWFINLPQKLGISFDTLISLFWGLAALIFYFLVYKISKNRVLGIISFITVLFCPSAYEYNTGIHFYRNIIIAPALFIFFGALCSLLYFSWYFKKQTIIYFVINSLILAFIYPFAFYIKEDGFWMKPVILFFLMWSLLGIVINIIWVHKISVTKGLLSIICLTLPILNFNYQTNRYISANERAFNYSDITLRCGGSFATVINKIYKIKSPDRNYRIWAPRDAIAQAIAVSPTLQNMPDLIERITTYPWFEGTEIHGDFLPWITLFSLNESNQYTNAQQIEEICSKINEELDTAFKTGELQKDSRIQITSSAGGRDLNEILMMVPDIIQLYQTVIHLKGYDDKVVMPTQEDQEYIASFTKKFNKDLTYPKNDEMKKNFERKNQIGSQLADFDFSIYRIWIPILFYSGLITWVALLIMGIKKIIKLNIIQWITLASVFVIIGISLVYAAGIIWFCGFLVTAGNIQDSELWRIIFYGVGLVPIVYSALLIMMPLIWDLMKYVFYQSRNRMIRHNN